MHHLFRAAFARRPRPAAGRRPPRPPVRLYLEELESRALLSAGAGWAAPANLDATPLAGPSVFKVYTPSQIRHAYGFDQVAFGSVAGDGTGQTIAVVDAYDAPDIGRDLHAFDAEFGLSDPTLIKATPEGKPAANDGWAGEITLDVEWAHAIAPKATILLVEAASNSDADLLKAVDYARNYAGVSVVSMSWGGSEFSSESAFDSHFTTPSGHNGVTFVAAAGDGGARSGPEWPAVSPNVLAVGGTTLNLSGSTYVSETGWSGSGGGNSQYVPEPSYQRGVQSSGKRSNPDVAYDANPNTGVYVYFTTPSTNAGGWYAFGGTSIGAPQWAALIAVADQGRALAGKGSLSGAQALVYTLPAADFHDITSGSNGFSARAGFDLVTGRGTPVANRVVADLVKAAPQTTSKTSAATPAATTPTTGGQTATTADVSASVALVTVVAADLPAGPAVVSPTADLSRPFVGLAAGFDSAAAPALGDPAHTLLATHRLDGGGGLAALSDNAREVLPVPQQEDDGDVAAAPFDASTPSDLAGTVDAYGAAVQQP
jgi:subtilase family serine protease